VNRIFIRPLVAAGSLAVLFGMWATPASAHVDPDPSEAPAGSEQLVNFLIPHGCDGSPTIKVAMKIPAGAQAVKPQQLSGWTVTTTTGSVTPYDDDGQQITEGATEVMWEGGPLPDDQVQQFALSLRLPDGKAGDVVEFPTVQTCAVGSTSWIEQTPKGGEEPEHPVPAITLTEAAADGGHDHVASSGSADTEGSKAGGVAKVATAAAVVNAQDAASTARTWGLIGVAVGLVGVLIAVAALLRSSSKGEVAPPAQP